MPVAKPLLWLWCGGARRRARCCSGCHGGLSFPPGELHVRRFLCVMLRPVALVFVCTYGAHGRTRQGPGWAQASGAAPPTPCTLQSAPLPWRVNTTPLVVGGRKRQSLHKKLCRPKLWKFIPFISVNLFKNINTFCRKLGQACKNNISHFANGYYFSIELKGLFLN